MTAIPIPRSYQEILGDMVDAFLAKYGINSLMIGGPILSLFESAAQSDLRSSQDLFNFLNSISLDRATGTALDRIGADENIPRIIESSATGKITIEDSTITKKSTKIYQGFSAPVVGSTTIYVQDASGWPATGSIYLGRGTTNYEGPLVYTAIAHPSTYYVITLNPSSQTRKFHNTGEEVVLAQNGDRTISAGTSITTVRTSVSEPIQYTTLYTETLQDGEDTLEDIAIIAVNPGSSSNVPALSINTFSSIPFAGAIVYNPLPITNGIDTESDDEYRERIKNIRQSRSKGIPLAIKTGVLGIIATDENKKVVSSSISSIPGQTSTLYIDDGAGYEEISEGKPSEVLIDSASGGETTFQLVDGRPVAKANVISINESPFELETDSAAALVRGYISKLAVEIGGVVQEHLFEVADFVNPASATSYEIASSINSNSTLLFSARTVESGSKIQLIAKFEDNESIEVVTASDPDHDTNDILNFPVGLNNTLWLYKNDVLLDKDGALATVTSNATALWGSMSSPVTITMAIDGTPAATYTITNSDFINNNTGYTTISRTVPVSAWVIVFNAVIPGITASESAGKLVLTSNLLQSDRASLEITGGTLVASNMFEIETSQGNSSDYLLDRNTGQVQLSTALVANDTLSAGTSQPEAFIQSSSFNSVTIASNAEFWWCFNAPYTPVEHTITSSTSLTFTCATSNYGLQVTVSAASTVFSNAQIGDWLILWDTTFNALDKGAYRIVDVTGGGLAVVIEHTNNTIYTLGNHSVTPAEVGVTIARTTGVLQKTTILFATSPTWTPYDLVDSLNTQLEGALASVYKNSYVRVATTNSDSTGAASLVAQNTQAINFGFTLSSSENNQIHTASVEMGHDDSGTPSFNCIYAATPYVARNVFDISSATGLELDQIIRVRKQFAEDALYKRYGPNKDFTSSINNVSGTTVTLQKTALSEWTDRDFLYSAAPLALSAEDTLVSLVDNDYATKRFTTNMYRRIISTDTTYSSTPLMRDLDNLVGGVPAPLSTAFGSSFDFSDFQFYAKARCKSLPSDSNQTMLWWWKKYGLDGERARMRFDNSTSASQALSVSVDITTQNTSDVTVHLPSGAARTGLPIRNSMRVGLARLDQTLGIVNLYYFWGLEASSGTRDGAGNVTMTLTLPGGGSITDHGLQITDFIHFESSDADFPTGNFVLTGRSPTTITYTQAGAIVTKPNPGAVCSDVAITSAADSNWSSTAVAANDIMTVGLSTGLGAAVGSTSTYKTTGRIITKQDRYLISKAQGSGDVTTIAWYQLSDVDGISVYPLDTANCTIDNIATTVNALDGSCPLTAYAIGTGVDHSGSVLLATWDQLNNSSTWYSLTDGIHQVQSVSVGGGDYTFTFKDAIDAANLATNSRWNYEEIRIAPTTAKGVYDLLNAPAMGGLHASGDVQLSSNGKRVQIGTATVGSAGSIQIQGGTGNSVSVPILDSAALAASSKCYATANATTATGLMSGMWVLAENQLAAPKNIFSTATVLQALTLPGAGTIRLDFSAGPDCFTKQAASASATIQVEVQGQLVAYTHTTLTGTFVGTTPSEGSYVYVEAPGAGSPLISAANTGWFKVLRVATLVVGPKTILTWWVQNDNAIEETALARVQFFSSSSLLPGDQLVISSNVWGAQMRGIWEIATIGGDAIGGPYSFTDQTIIDLTLVGSITPSGPFSALGTNLPFVQTFEGSPSNLLKQIYSITPDPDDEDLTNIKFDTAVGYTQISLNYGTVLQALDKLNFPTDSISGVDGYRYNTGLIHEANKVVYGDERDSVTYPGIAAAGSIINISSPLVKRPSISLEIRTTNPTAELTIQIRSAVASVVNSTGVGESLAISDIVAAAGNVSGVTSVTIISPTYTTGYDLITVQTHEKLMILDLEQDIQVSYVGV